MIRVGQNRANRRSKTQAIAALIFSYANRDPKSASKPLELEDVLPYPLEDIKNDKVKPFYPLNQFELDEIEEGLNNRAFNATVHVLIVKILR